MNSITLQKVRLLISDYTQATDNQDKDLFLSISGNYIHEIRDPEIELMYYRLCESADLAEKELYTEILIDLLENRGGNNG